MIISVLQVGVEICHFSILSEIIASFYDDVTVSMSFSEDSGP